MENDEDYQLQQELESLAGNVFDPGSNDIDSGSDIANKPIEPISITIDRWKHLFGLSADDAVDGIQMHRNNLTRARVSDEHWEVVRREREGQGYDREAYEYELEMQRRKAALPTVLPTEEGRQQDDRLKYFVELDGPLSTIEDVQKAAGMSTLPTVVAGRSLEEGRSVSLCCIDGAAQAALLRWAADRGGGYEPTILVDPRSMR